MKKTLIVSLVMFALTVSACAPQMTATPAPIVTEEVQVSTAEPPVEPPTERSYINSAFGFGFQFPKNWYGPEEYVSGQDLRVEVGSDKVYPYGSDPSTRIYDLKNSYNIVIQYSKSGQNRFLTDPSYLSLLTLKDGESVSNARSLLTRVRQVEIGGFKGFESLVTLSESAQTDRFYIRSVILFDAQNNTLAIMGQPLNVEVNDGEDWRVVYQAIDEANVKAFHGVLESITIK
jgi:hypothetical protein